MAEAGLNGITESTPENIPFGAGTIHKGLKYTPGASGGTGSWNFAETLVGSTQGGSKWAIVPVTKLIEIDGADVAVIGMRRKIGETGTMEINFAEITPDVLKAGTLGQGGTSPDTSYTMIEADGGIDTGDYWENIAFVGKTLAGKDIIAIMGNALCTSGFDLDNKAKENGIVKLTFESHAEPGAALDRLPWRVYWPKGA